MKKFTTKNKLGFSLLELMVVVAIIGVLATFAVPRFNIFRARARQGEAKSNLGVIFTLQEAFKIDKERYYNGDDAYWGGDGMDSSAKADSVGYAGGTPADTDCKANKLGFRLANCTASRYRYWIDKDQTGEDDFAALAFAASDVAEKRIFPGCTGTLAANGSTPTASVGGATACTGGDDAMPSAGGDAFCLDERRTVYNFRDIVSDPDCTD